MKKVSGSTTAVYIFSGSKVIAEYDNGAAVGSPSREYLYSGGALLAKIEGGATTYYHPDHLSNRVMTDSSGTSSGSRGHYPYGETWYESGTTTKLKFTTYERDSESGNDFAIARFHNNRLGRFSSPDLMAGSISDPQSLNRFTYTLNDPANLVDPLGMNVMAIGNCYINYVDYGSESTYWFGGCFGGIGVGPAGPIGDSGGGAFKKDFYGNKELQKKLQDCINKVFGPQDAPNVPPQTINNSPTIDTSKSSAQLNEESGGTAGVSWNNPPPKGGTNGTVYIPGNIWQNAGLTNVSRVYTHELGNILDERLYPDTKDPKYGKHHGSLQTLAQDYDTGQALEDCVFGRRKY